MFAIAAVFGPRVWDAWFSASNLAIDLGGGASSESTSMSLEFDVIAVAVYALLAMTVLVAVYDESGRFRNALAGGGSGRRFSWAARIPHPRNVVVCCVFMLLCWSPYILMLAPGSFTYDAIIALLQDAGSGVVPSLPNSASEGAFLAQKPLVHQWLLGLFLWIGTMMGSQSIGMFLFCILQCLCTAATLSYACIMPARFGVSSIVQIVGIVFCALFPLFPLYAMSGWNDSTFSWVFLAWMCLVAQLAYSGGKVLYSKSFLVALIVFGVFVALFKTVGVVIVVITLLLAMLVCMPSVRARLLCAALMPFVIAVVIMPLVVYPLAHAVPSQRDESMATLWQMTARYVQQYEDEVTDEERAIIDAVVEYARLAEVYDEGSQDPVKLIQRTDADVTDKLAYVSTWAAQGLRHPEVYLSAIAHVVAPFALPNADFKYYDTSSPYTFDEQLGYVMGDAEAWGADARVARTAETLDIHPLFDLADAQVALRDLMSGAMRLPFGAGLGLGLYATWLPLAFMVIMIARKSSFRVLCIPIVLSMLLLLISPRAMARYALPLAYCAPLMVLLLFTGTSRFQRQAQSICERAEGAL